MEPLTGKIRCLKETAAATWPAAEEALTWLRRKVDERQPRRRHHRGSRPADTGAADAALVVVVDCASDVVGSAVGELVVLVAPEVTPLAWAGVSTNERLTTTVIVTAPATIPTTTAMFCAESASTASTAATSATMPINHNRCDMTSDEMYECETFCETFGEWRRNW